MAADIRTSMQAAASIPDRQKMVDQYQLLLSSIISSSNGSHAKAFIDHMVSGEVPAAVSRAMLHTFSQEFLKMEPEACKDVFAHAILRTSEMVPLLKKEISFPSSMMEGIAGQDCSDMGVSWPHQTVTGVGDKLVCFGGMRDKEPLNVVDIYDTVSGSWISPVVLGTPPTPRYGHSAVLLNEERILIFGGHGVMPGDMIWLLEVGTRYVKKQSQLSGRDVVAWSKGVLGNMPQPVVICGPSGVGKGTLITRLMRDFPCVFGFSVSHTTRQPRQAEKCGVHYHFTQRKLMELEIQEGKFLESADVHGNLYGTSVAAVEAVANAGKRCILDIDVQGAQAVKKSGLDALFIFIAPPSLERLEHRLRGRGTETEEQICKRLNNARVELEHGRHSWLFNHYVVNDDLEECYSELKKLLGLEHDKLDVVQDGSEEQVILGPRYGHSASLVGQNVFLVGGRADEGYETALVMLDVSKLTAGAPGQTTGLRFSRIESSHERHKLRNGVNPSFHSASSMQENGHL